MFTHPLTINAGQKILECHGLTINPYMVYPERMLYKK